MRFYGFDEKQAKKLKLMCDNHQPCVLKNCIIKQGKRETRDLSKKLHTSGTFRNNV